MTSVSIPEAIQMAVQHQQAGRYANAENIYRQVLQADPNQPDALHLLGLLAHQTGHHGEAIELIGKALVLEPAMPAFHCNIALAYQSLGNLDAAIAHFGKAIELKPDHALAYNNLGNIHKSLNNREQAGTCYRKALALLPSFAEAHNNLGVISQELGQLDAAIQAFHAALTLKPDYAEAHNNLGIALKKHGQLDDAVASYQRALSYRPGYDDALSNLGVAYQALGKVDQAGECFRTLLTRRPEYAPARYNLALCLLLQGNYADGLELYESRLQGGPADEATRAMQARLAAIPRWQNQDLHGKTLLVWAEQGLGDTLMMLRYLPLLTAKNPGEIRVACDAALARLVETLPGVASVVTPEQAPCDANYQVPMMSLPQRFATRLATIPNRVPYLTVPVSLREKWHARLASTPGLKVGLAWAGNPAFAADAVRSLDLREFAPLLDIGGITLISLQKGAPARQVHETGWPIHDWMAECTDFLDTGALLENLDLVISVDTAVAHLAGALGKPVWLLNRFESEWRWLLDREDSPWYPTLRLFRQPAPGDWHGVVARVAEELATLAVA